MRNLNIDFNPLNPVEGWGKIGMLRLDGDKRGEEEKERSLKSWMVGYFSLFPFSSPFYFTLFFFTFFFFIIVFSFSFDLRPELGESRNLKRRQEIVEISE